MESSIQTVGSIQLSWEDFHWEGVIVCLGNFGDEVGLHINTKDEEQLPIHSDQEDIVFSLLDDSSGVYDVIIEAMFEYYCKIRPRYEAAGEEWIEAMPVLSTVMVWPARIPF